MLYYLKQEVIGNEFQKVFDGTDARWAYGGFFSLFTLNVNLPNENEVFPDLNKNSCKQVFVYLISEKSVLICSVHKMLCIY